MTRRAAREASPLTELGPPTALAAVAPVLLRTVVLAEDARFHEHGGIDFGAIREAVGVRPHAGWLRTAWVAWTRRDRIRGASTLTQQLAKNLYLSPARSAPRKLKEAVTALRLEGALTKERILELYLNVAEWGPRIWGIGAASRAYYGVRPSQLDLWQAAELAATLPHPRSSNPATRPAAMAEGREMILARYYGRDTLVPPDPIDGWSPAWSQALPPLRPLPALDSALSQPTPTPDSQVPRTAPTPAPPPVRDSPPAS